MVYKSWRRKVSWTPNPTCTVQDPLHRRHPLGRPQPIGPHLHGTDSREPLHLRPAQDRPPRKPPLPDSGAQSPALRKGQGYCGSCCQAIKQASRCCILLYGPGSQAVSSLLLAFSSSFQAWLADLSTKSMAKTPMWLTAVLLMWSLATEIVVSLLGRPYVYGSLISTALRREGLKPAQKVGASRNRIP
jgi:hypothetical protein